MTNYCLEFYGVLHYLIAQGDHKAQSLKMSLKYPFYVTALDFSAFLLQHLLIFAVKVHEKLYPKIIVLHKSFI